MASVGSQDAMLRRRYGLVGLQYLDFRHRMQVQATSVAHGGKTARSCRHGFDTLPIILTAASIL